MRGTQTHMRPRRHLFHPVCAVSLSTICAVSNGFADSMDASRDGGRLLMRDGMSSNTVCANTSEGQWWFVDEGWKIFKDGQRKHIGGTVAGCR